MRFVNIGVSYDTDLRHAMDVIKAVGEELQKDTKLRSSIIDPIEVSASINSPILPSCCRPASVPGPAGNGT